MSDSETLTWTPLDGGFREAAPDGGQARGAGAGAIDAGDLGEVVRLAARCLAADGGIPIAADAAFLRGRWSAPGTIAVACRTGAGLLRAAGAVRPARDASGATFTGLVDPDVRGRGLGARLLDWGLAEAARRGGQVTVETESLTRAAERLFASRGLHQIFAEDVMRIDLTTADLDPADLDPADLGPAHLDPVDLDPVDLGPAGLGPAHFDPVDLDPANLGPAHRGTADLDAARPARPGEWPAGTSLLEWSDATAPRFHAVYEAAFRERPGFPGWPAAKWISDVAEDDEFRPRWSLLASIPGLANPGAGFVTAAVGWIVQVGVVPAARGKGLGAALIRESLARMRADGAGEAWLDVNVNNPASRLYRRLGFEDRGRRARYRPGGER